MFRSAVFRGAVAFAVASALILSAALPPTTTRAVGPGNTSKLRLAPPAPPVLPSGPLHPVDVPAPLPAAKVSGGEFLKPVDLKILVISADGAEVSLGAITTTLNYLGTPYTVVNAYSQPGWLKPSNLVSGSKGLYQGVILTTDSLGTAASGNWQSALTLADWENLRDYQRNFGVRQATWYTYPNADLGYGSITYSGPAEIKGTLTAAGHSSVFKYMNLSASVAITNSYTYLAKTVTTDTIPILVDQSGNALVSIHTYPDGRENIAMTFDSNQYQTHSNVLSYGIVNWVTKGLFLGERHAFLSAQNDDIFLPDDIWDTQALTTTGLIIDRMTGDDIRALVKWQDSVNKRPTTKNVVMQYAYNAIGTTSEYETAKSALPDPGDVPLASPLKLYSKPKDDKASLTAAVRQNQSNFMFINHTWDHTNLDSTTFSETYSELMRNINQARLMGLKYFSSNNLVTPDVSGLHNPSALQAMAAAGVKNLVSDTSRANGVEMNPFPNVGIPNWISPTLYMIPRYPTNLYYNVRTPEEWTSEYNFIYGPTSTFWTGRPLTYGEILDREANMLLGRLLQGDINPVMFHQANTIFYDKSHSLQTDLLDRLFQKYNALFNLPILSLQMDDIGTRMRDRSTFLNAGVTATYNPSTKQITIRTGSSGAIVPVTGIQTKDLTEELYGAQYISHFKLDSNSSVTYTATNRGAPVASLSARTGASRKVSTDAPDQGDYCDNEGCEQFEDEDPCDYEEDEDYQTADAAEYFEVVVPNITVQ